METVTTPVVKKRRLLEPVNLNLSQEVEWKSFDDSPQRNVKEKSKTADLAQTPVRIVKRHVSSPSLLTSTKPSNLSRFQIQLDAREDTGRNELPSTKAQLEELEIAQTLAFANLDDSFDDAIFNSIPLDLLSKQCSSSTVDIVYNSHERSSQLLQPKKSLPRHSSDPINSTVMSDNIHKKDVHKLTEPPKKVGVSHGKKIYGNHATVNKIVHSYQIFLGPIKLPYCTPAEIAEKRRQALERLKKSKKRKS